MRYFAAVVGSARPDAGISIEPAHQPLGFSKFKLVNELQFSNACLSMLDTLLGILIDFRESQLANVRYSILSTPVPIITEVRALQPKNAFLSMVVTLSGIVIIFSESQLINDQLPIFVVPFEIVTVVSDFKSANA